MEAKKASKRYSPEVRDRAVRMVLEHQGEHESQWGAICSIAAQIGCSGETLRKWVRQMERDQGARPAHASFVLDALEPAFHDRRPVQGGGLVHHSDRGVQHVSIRYTERLVEAGIEPSVSCVDDSYDNALAETISGLFETEVIRRRGP